MTAYGGSFYAATGSDVDTLYDQSGNGRNLTSSGGARPSLSTVGSIASLRFTSPNDDMNAAVALSNFITTTTGYMIATVNIVSLAASTGTGFQGTPIMGSGDYTVGMRVTNNASDKYYAQTWASGDKSTTGHSISTGTTYVLEWRHESGTMYSRLNGASEQSVAAVTSDSTSNGLRLGHTSYSGHIIEAATFSTVPGSTERDALVQALGLYAGASV